MTPLRERILVWIGLLFGLAFCAMLYLPGLSGGFLFDDFPNIVDNRGLQIQHADLPSLINAALSSPSSDLKRPLASLSFAANYLATGLAATPMKATNLAIHLLNGVVAFFFLRSLLRLVPGVTKARGEGLALLIVIAWAILPINITAVLYVVQRMESLANLFVLLGLWGYIAGRERMQRNERGFALAVSSLLGGSVIGLLAKETAIMTPLYAAIIEIFLLHMTSRRHDGRQEFDKRIAFFFVVSLVVPAIIGACWLLPRLLSPAAWANRDFTLSTRLLSEARIVVDYIGWTLIPTPESLSFYHDDFAMSKGWLDPPTTLLAMLTLLLMVAGIVWARRQRPLLSTGLALYLGAHLLTGTVIPLELIYEHRNYFPSLAILIAVAGIFPLDTPKPAVRRALTAVFALVGIYAAALTWQTTNAWGSPLDLAREFADRAPDSPRAQYELGRAYIIESHYDRNSPFVALAYPPLEQAASLPDATILPLQALIFFNARLGKPIDDRWWSALIERLRERRARIEDESSLISLTQCMRSDGCQLSKERMQQAYEAAISHPRPSGRLLSAYSDYAWNVLDDKALGERLARDAVMASPGEPVYLDSLARMQISQSHLDDAEHTLIALHALNYGGRLNDNLGSIRRQIDAARKSGDGH